MMAYRVVPDTPLDDDPELLPPDAARERRGQAGERHEWEATATPDNHQPALQTRERGLNVTVAVRVGSPAVCRQSSKHAPVFSSRTLVKTQRPHCRGHCK